MNNQRIGKKMCYGLGQEPPLNNLKSNHRYRSTNTMKDFNYDDKLGGWHGLDEKKSRATHTGHDL